VHEQLDIPTEVLLNGTGLNWDYLCNPKNRVGLDELTQIARNTVAAIGGEKRLRQLLEHNVRKDAKISSKNSYAPHGTSIDACLTFFHFLRKQHTECVHSYKKLDRQATNLAHDLHDSLGQHLTGIAYKLKSLESQLTRCSSCPMTPAVSELVDLANRAFSLTRDLVHSLAPVDLVPCDLIPAIHRLCASVSQLFNLSCIFHAPAENVVLSSNTANQLYRAIQEAITNAHRHGHAKTIEIRLTPTDERHLVITIDDQGIGLPAGFSPLRNPGLGLKIMCHRLASVGGRVRLGKSPVSSGARATFIVPTAVARPSPAKRKPTHRFPRP
jgi:signal transduction histidine kinase